MTAGFLIRRLLPLFLAIALVSNARTAGAESRTERVNNAVVKIFSVIRTPSYFQPWQFDSSINISGSGVIISGRRILTNAHVVADSVFIEVKKVGDPRKYAATVEATGHQCDLAVLKVKDARFFDGVTPLKFDGLPGPMDRITVHGYPEGGDDISVTQGVVSRIEQVRYAHSGFDLLGVQVDAAINPGNSGGPAVKGDKLIGIAMQTLSTAQNISYVIPTPIIEHFLEDVKDGVYDGFPEDGIITQAMENESLRKYYGLSAKQSGVLVIEVSYGGSAWGIVKPDDVITSIDGVPVGNDGAAPLNKGLRAQCDHLVQKRFLGDTLKYGVIRDKKPMTLSLRLKKPAQLVPYEQSGGQPSYYIYGGLVFMPLTVNYLMTWGEQWWKDAPVDLLHAQLKEHPSEQRNQMVILRKVLAHEINAGYHEYQDRIVNKVNGVTVLNMTDLVMKLKSHKGTFTILELESGGRIALDTAAVAKTKGELLKLYGIQNEASVNLMELKGK
jgi:S1-C subfamily serine protease